MRKMFIALTTCEHSRAEPFPPLTLGLLPFLGGGPLDRGQCQPELRMCQPLLFYSGRVVSFGRQMLATYAASGIPQPSSPFYVDLNTYAL